MDTKYLAEIKAREQVATPGPWEEKTNRHPQCNGEPWGWISGAAGNITWSGYVGKTNADFIAHAREDIPYLLAEIERLHGLLAERNVLLDKYEAENRWIPVSERLPEVDDVEVLVIASGKPHENITLDGAYMLATYSRPEGWILDEYPEWECANVTHWMPLPDPPKGE